MKTKNINTDFSPLILGGTQNKVVSSNVLDFNEKQKLVFLTEYALCIKLLEELGFQKISPEVAREENEENKSQKKEYFLQDRFEYFSRTGYGVLVFPGTFSEGFGKNISSSVSILDKDKNHIWSRTFLRRHIVPFFNYLNAYIQAAKYAVDHRPKSTRRREYMSLVAKDNGTHVWETTGQSQQDSDEKERLFDIRSSVYESMSDQHVKAVFRKEFNRKKYFKK